MIQIKRAAVRAGRIVEPVKRWRDQAQTATEAAVQTVAEGKAHVADDAIYGHADVRAALEALFHGKCAYCESFVAASSDWDVEHFRPKGRVKESPQHLGYYWLAYTWANLFPSCKLCNQKRKDKPLFEDARELPAAGKLDQFPLRDETKRAMRHTDDLGAEEPLLIDPCADEPEKLLSVTLTGALVAIGGADRGTTTMRVMNLNRRRLKKIREIKVSQAIKLMKLVLLARRAGAAQDEAVLLDAYHGFTADHQEYAAVFRAVERDRPLFGLG